MTEVIAFPDVEAALVATLPALVGVPVSTRVPNPRPTSFVRLKRVGGGQRNRVTDAAVLVFECWAETNPDASDLARRTRAHVHSLAQGTHADAWVRRVVEVSGPSDFPDPVSDTPRYQFTAQIDTRGAPL